MEDPTSSDVTAAASSKTARAVAASDAAAAPTAGACDDERIDGVPLVDAGAEARDGRVCGAGGGSRATPPSLRGLWAAAKISVGATWAGTSQTRRAARQRRRTWMLKRARRARKPRGSHTGSVQEERERLGGRAT